MAFDVSLLAWTPEPERVVAAAARNCYSGKGASVLFDQMDEKETARFLDMFTQMGHDSLAEHAVFTFAVDGVSRSLLAQLTRHRIASFAVKSQRYTSESGFEAIAPPAIMEIPEAADVFQAAMEDSRRRYNELAELLVRHGREKRQAYEDARYVLPAACSTNLVVTMNARELRHFFALRLCRRAQWEIQNLAARMLKLSRNVAPRLFRDAGPGCLRGKCPEGAYSCGQAAAVRAEYGVSIPSDSLQ